MGIQKFFYETTIVLTIITLFVVIFNSIQVQRSAALRLQGIEEQYLNATFEIYQNQLIGDILIGDNNIISSFIQEISEIRNVGVTLVYDNKTLSAGLIDKNNPGASYTLNIDNKKKASLKLFLPQNKSKFDIFYESVFPIFLELIILCIGIYFLLKRLKQSFISPLNELVLNLGPGKIEGFEPHVKSVYEIKQLCTTLKKMNIDVKKNASYEAEVRAAKQVAHDIRSPLASLNLLLSAATALPEKQRVLMRTSIQRITDIANVLQKKADNEENKNDRTSDFENVMVVTLVELLVTEIRVQLGIDTNISIDLAVDKAYGLFSVIKVSEFNRVLSNLINNSLESFDEFNHNIKISIHSENNYVIVIIEDDGKGISESILDKVGTYGFTFGKASSKTSGNGLGVYHAINTINSFGGNFIIESELNIGTKVTIKLPQSPPPSWFVNHIRVSTLKKVIILDDDPSIHSLWKERLAIFSNPDLMVEYFIEPSEMKSYLQSYLINATGNFLVLLDYEFVGNSLNGLDIIEKFRINDYSILVTSHFDDKNIQNKAKSLGVGIIPKTIVPFVPIY
ncbi:sensor histidine kinase [Legionella jamestowniensis]|uniref:histidine kinase n=1 Tax=Legionella jamestowniensis TaxID=455 RepID=A0A0W0UZC8_9GAMM|nr:sensor histidine kinase [Legionella jamestowniensis]KTD13218.1 sensor histidine kinase [Legionella jamestowniensis]SFL78552.1 Signal transduction histidine kinase [Legionella jamestowniensis DSM 19215]